MGVAVLALVLDLGRLLGVARGAEPLHIANHVRTAVGTFRPVLLRYGPPRTIFVKVAHWKG